MSQNCNQTCEQPAPAAVRSSDGLCRDTTIEERMTWGECPQCHAKHGEPCNADVGIQLGVKVGGGRMKTGEGVHIQRLCYAPKRVLLVAA